MNLNVAIEFYNLINRKTQKDFFIFKGDDKNQLFCSGLDLKFFYEERDNQHKLNTFSDLTYYMLYKFHKEFCNNSIFIWNGVVMGGGLAFGVYSKFRIATETSFLAMPESIFGFFANCVFSQFISYFLTRKEAIHMAIFAHKYKGYQVFLKKFATHFILNKYIGEVITSIKKLIDPHNSFEVAKILEKYHGLSILEYNDKIKVETEIKQFNDYINKLYDFDIKDDDFLNFYNRLSEKLRKSNSKLYEELTSKSYISLNVNFNVANSSYDKNLTFEDRVDRDIYYSIILISLGNMHEGIRAFFVEKDKKPKWNG